MRFPSNYRLKEPIPHLLWGLVDICFSVITSTNRNLSGWNLEYKWGGTVRTHIEKNGGNCGCPRGSATGCQNVLLLFCYQGNAAFGHLSCTDFDHFWNNRRESLSACVHPWKISEFLPREFSRSQNSPKYGTLGWGVCDRAAAQTAQYCGRWESFQGLVDIPRMCHLYVSFGGGRTVWALSPEEAEILPNSVPELT